MLNTAPRPQEIGEVNLRTTTLFCIFSLTHRVKHSQGSQGEEERNPGHVNPDSLLSRQTHIWSGQCDVQQTVDGKQKETIAPDKAL